MIVSNSCPSAAWSSGRTLGWHQKWPSKASDSLRGLKLLTLETSKRSAVPSNWPPTHSASTGRNKFRSGDIPNSESPSLDSLSSYPELSRTFPQLYLEHSSNQKPPRAFPQNLPATSRNLCFFSATVFRIFKQPTWFPFAQKTQLRKSFARNLCWNFQNVLPGTYPTSNCPIAFRCRQLITSSTDSLIQITKIRSCDIPNSEGSILLRQHSNPPGTFAELYLLWVLGHLLEFTRILLRSLPQTLPRYIVLY